MNPFATEVTLGRTFNNDVVVDHQSISRFHAYFQLDPKRGVWRVVDAESKNGTWVRGRRIAGPCKLADGDAIRIGSVPITFRCFREEPATETRRD